MHAIFCLLSKHLFLKTETQKYFFLFFAKPAFQLFYNFSWKNNQMIEKWVSK